MKKCGWLLVAAMVLLSGCGEDDPDPVRADPVDVLPPTPGELVEAFVLAYQLPAVGSLAPLVHTEAKVFLLSSTLQDWEQCGEPLGFSSFGRDSLLAVHENIVAGGEGRTCSGLPVMPVESIQFEMVEPLGLWGPFADEAGDYPGLEVVSIRFQILLHFNNPDQHRFEVFTEVEIFATEIDQPNLNGWQLLGWREFERLARSSATENLAWGSLLTMYRPHG